jgi:hypothetical protein
MHKWRRRRQRARHTRDVRAATFLLISQNPKAVVRLKAPFPPPDIVVASAPLHHARAWNSAPELAPLQQTPSESVSRQYRDVDA